VTVDNPGTLDQIQIQALKIWYWTGVIRLWPNRRSPMKRLGMVLLGLMFWSMNTLAQVTGSLDPEENCYIGNANVYGKYSELIQRFDCPADMRWYPKFKDDGFWGGDGWHCERETVYNGYWVWVSPTWFVWESRPRRPDAMLNLIGTYGLNRRNIEEQVRRCIED